MIAIVGGLGAALGFAAATLLNSRASRIVDPPVLLAWVMLVGLAASGLGNVAGPHGALAAPAAVWLFKERLGHIQVVAQA